MSQTLLLIRELVARRECAYQIMVMMSWPRMIFL